MMRRLTFSIFTILFVVIIIIPAVIGKGCERKEQLSPRPENLEPEQVIKVYVTAEKKIKTMPLEIYIQGVVAAEMPASFELEALKSQAIAARTYAAKKICLIGGSGCDAHPGADICTDPTHCQDWISEETAKSRWKKEESELYWQRITDAVKATYGEVLTYEGELIDPVFHSTCGGHTENSEDVWSSAVPYLRGVECGYCNDFSHFTEEYRFTMPELEEKLGFSEQESKDLAALSQDGPKKMVMIEETTETGRVKKIKVGEKVFPGNDFRLKLDLRSTNFTFKRQDETFVFTTTGYGHGVGLCQYGANGMAKEGKDHKAILTHYYTGVKIEKAY